MQKRRWQSAVDKGLALFKFATEVSSTHLPDRVSFTPAPILDNLTMPRITLLVGSKITNLIQNSTVRFYTTGAQAPFAVVGAGVVLPLQNQRIVDFVIVSDAPDNNLNRRWDVPGAQNVTVDADGELSIGKKVDAAGNNVVDWHIKP